MAFRVSEKGNKGSNLVLQLFISGASPKSLRAVNNLRRICDQSVGASYNLEIVDVYKDSSLAIREQVVALPMLVKKHPLPERKLIGDMSNVEKVMEGLGLRLEHHES